MTHRPTSSHPVLRTLTTLAVAASMALMGAACMDPGSHEEGDEAFALGAVSCKGLRVFQPTKDGKPLVAGVNGSSFAAKEIVQLNGQAFQAFIGYTVVAPDWVPVSAPSLWNQIGTCNEGAAPPPANNGGNNNGGQPPVVTPPPATPPPVVTPPPANGQCLQNGKAPPFDPAGVKNIGNGRGTQFIGGQCLSNADCGSGCCALPCGICSGPAANFQNGKQGCGFGSK